MLTLPGLIVTTLVFNSVRCYDCRIDGIDQIAKRIQNCLDHDDTNIALYVDQTMELPTDASIVTRSARPEHLKTFKVVGHLRTITPIMFKNLPNVECIDLSDNSIETFATDVFINDQLPHLKHLEMNNNPLDDVGMQAWNDVKQALRDRAPDSAHIHFGSIVTIAMGIVIVLIIVVMVINSMCKDVRHGRRLANINSSHHYEIPGAVSPRTAESLMYGNPGQEQLLVDLSEH